ncbi:phosphate ABC transporter substrate-binding protein PstS [Reyranella sp.]|uniref:phosphate ABC transporter substrate-binding protein PstS n=1 Tax=Reyranella sp. TaxID=1929291 RepID=UPI003D0A57F8
MNFLRRLAIGAALILGVVTPAVAQEITGAGSTFVAPAMAKWAGEYEAKGFPKVHYQPIGSGAGIAQIKAGTVDFGASDAPLKPDDLAKAGLRQFPLVIGGIVPVVHIAGIKAGELRLTGRLLADIFLGKTKKWNDPEIAKLNPSLTLPAAGIIVAHRTDGSGTTFNWTNYLSKASDEWRGRVGEGIAVSWPTGAGGKGNEGVAALVGQTPNAIGYVEYAYALQNKLAFALVQNKAGTFVEPNTASFQAAAASADWASARDFYLIMTDAPGESAYPIAATAFVLVSKEAKAVERSKATINFFRWVFENGQKAARDLDYVPLPASLVASVERYWGSEFSFAK